MELGGSNPDGPLLCEVSLSILIVIRVKRGSSLRLIALADSARGEAETVHENMTTTGPFSILYMYTHAHTVVVINLSQT